MNIAELAYSGRSWRRFPAHGERRFHWNVNAIPAWSWTIFVVRWNGDDDAVPASMRAKTATGIAAKKSGGGGWRDVSWRSRRAGCDQAQVWAADPVDAWTRPAGALHFRPLSSGSIRVVYANFLTMKGKARVKQGRTHWVVLEPVANVRAAFLSEARFLQLQD